MSIDDDLLFREQAIEQCALCSFLTRRLSPVGTNPSYFQGKERLLFDETNRQIIEYNEIDLSVIDKKFPKLLEDVLDKSDTVGRAGLDSLHRAWVRRETAKALLYNSDDPVEKAMFISKRMSELLTNNPSKKEYNHALAGANILDISRKMADSEISVYGWRSTIESLDNVMGGFLKGKMVIVGALKKTGKSLFTTFLSMKFAEQGAYVMLNSLEMSDEQLNTLAFSNYSVVDSVKIARRKSIEETERVAGALKKFLLLDWVICSERSLAGLKTEIERQNQKRKVDVVVVDYIQRMQTDLFRNNKVSQIEHIANGLADIAHDTGVVMIVLSQVRGEAEQLDKKVIPDMSWLKGSHALGESADVVLMMHNPRRGENPMRGIDGSYVDEDFMISVTQRSGVSNVVVDVSGDMRVCKFYENRGGKF